MGIITDIGLQHFLYSYLYTDYSGIKPIDLVHGEDASITPVNSVVLGVIVNVQAENPTIMNWYPIYDNVTPLLKKVEQREWDDIWRGLEDIGYQLETVRYQLKTDLSAHIQDKNNPHQVTKHQVGLGQLINNISSEYNIGMPPTLALETNFGVWKHQWVKHISFHEIPKDASSAHFYFSMGNWTREQLPDIQQNWLIEGTIQAFSHVIGDKASIGVIQLPQAVTRITVYRPSSESSTSYGLDLRYNGAALRDLQDEIGSGTPLVFVFVLKITIPPYLMNYSDTPLPPI